MIALLAAELFKILIYANYMSVMSQKGHKVVQNHKKMNICANTKSTGLKCHRHFNEIFSGKLKTLDFDGLKTDIAESLLLPSNCLN